MTATRKPQVRAGPVRHALREFWGGLTDLSGLSLAICGIAFACICTFTAWFFHPATMAGPLGDFVPRSSRDADAFALVEALRLSETNVDTPTVLFLGSSAVAQMVGDGTRLKARLSDAHDDTWDVRVLTTPLQSPLDQMRLLETALKERDAESAPLLVVMGIGLTRLGWTEDRMRTHSGASRIPLRSDWADAYLAEWGVPLAPRRPLWALEHSDFIMLNGMKSLTRLAMGQKAMRKVDSYARGRAPDAAHGARLADTIRNAVPHRAEFFELQEEMIERIAAVPQTALVLMEEPLSPDFIETHDLAELMALFQTEVTELAERTGTAYWPIIEAAELPQEHYFDPLHLLPGEAQDICADRIAAHLEHFATVEGKT